MRDLQLVIGDEAREQALAAEGSLPARVIACVGGGSNSIGTFVPFLDDEEVELIGVEAAGEGLDSGRTGASLTAGRTGVLHGALSAVLADEDGQILEAHSVSAGLDYPGVGPQHAHLRDTGRVRYEAVTDDEALSAFRELARLEGIIPALEPSHARGLAASPTKIPRHLLGFACGRARVRRGKALRPPDALRPRRQGPRRGGRAIRRWLNGSRPRSRRRGPIGARR